MGGVGLHAAPFAQRLEYEHDVALLEVAHAAVDELRGAAGGAFGEILALEQRHGVASQRGIDGAAEPRGSAAYDHYVPGSGGVLNLFQHFFSLHIDRFLQLYSGCES